MPNVANARQRFLLGVFVVSGFTGLIYESIWSHYLKLFLGHAAYAQTLVLAIFMGGMALGAWLVARYCARLRRLLWGYLLVEALIGVFGILFHRLFVGATDVSFAVVIPALPAGLAINLYKWSLAALLVLPQSVLLGMTFPLISGGIIRRWPEHAGETLSVLYFTNSLGGALGVLVSGFVLIDLVGLPGTTLTAGLLNIALALVVWLVVRDQAEPPKPSPDGSARAATRAFIDPVARWFAIAAFLTGAASFMYELGWIRMLSLVLGSSTHSFELMLSAFIFGLAFGGLYVRKRIERIADPERYLGTIMLIMGVLAALTVPACNLMYDVMAWALRTFKQTEGGYVAFNTLSQSIAMLIMFPATFCAGMTLPVLTHALRHWREGYRRDLLRQHSRCDRRCTARGAPLAAAGRRQGCDPHRRGHTHFTRSIASRRARMASTRSHPRDIGRRRSVRLDGHLWRPGSAASRVRGLPHRDRTLARQQPSHLPTRRQDRDRHAARECGASHYCNEWQAGRRGPNGTGRSGRRRGHHGAGCGDSAKSAARCKTRG